MEVKKAEGGLPGSLWDTYSSFANCYGGVIILGVKENKDGIKICEKLKKDFWNTINNRKKVSLNILTMAKREPKLVYINDDLFGGTFRRNHDGDYIV